MPKTKRGLAMLGCFLLAANATMPASAIEPYKFDPARDKPPAAGKPSPGVEMEQKTECATSAVLPDSQFRSIPAQKVFSVERLHDFATGRGQRVAVIDSGVTPNARLPRLEGLGDYVAGGDGLSDCDHHGTLIAGIIAAGAARNDGFIGVAPDATVLSIRQTSSAFGTKNYRDEPPSSIHTLAAAVRTAADAGATVVNMSVTACYPAGQNVDLHELAGALNYAANEKNVVLVASAGNVDKECQPNPGADPANLGNDPRGWESIQTVSVPSLFDDFVLSVGGTTLTGDPYVNTLPGAWVDVAAPAVNIVSLDPTHGEQGGLINAEVTREGAQPITGTSFAAAYVSGLAALIRERHPELTSKQVRQRIIATAHQSGEGARHIFGEGLVDPVAALTAENIRGETTRQTFEPTIRSQPQPMKRLAWAPIAIAALLMVTVVGACAWYVFRYRLERFGAGSGTSKANDHIDPASVFYDGDEERR